MANDELENSPTIELVAAAALIAPTGEILVQDCPIGHRYEGLWEFPGGKVEPGETAEGALVRELREELSIVVDPNDCIACTFASDPDQRIAARSPYVILLYTCRVWEGEIVPREGQAVRWVARDALPALAMPPLDVPLARWLQQLS